MESGPADSEVPNMERHMINEFMKKYPDIKVEIIERPKNQVQPMIWTGKIS